MSSLDVFAATEVARNSYLEQLRDRALREDPSRSPNEIEQRAQQLFVADRVHAGRASGVVRKRQKLTALATEALQQEALETAELLLEILRSEPDITKHCSHVWPGELDTEAQCEVCGLLYIEFT